MNDRNKDNPSDTETILMALDQISQTIDVMTSVVGRLRHFVQQQESLGADATPGELTTEVPNDRVVH